VGRDALFFELEVAARLQKVVVLHGPGGTGKTELAKAFGRWWRDTGGVEDPRLVFWHSFEPGVASFGLDGVITEIGLGVYGPDFAALDPADRHSVVQDLLARHRLLLIWDNFETVRSMPDPAGATPPLGPAGCQDLKGFLDQVARGRSAVIITSRTSEDWLGVRRIGVGGLASHEAAEYAGELLAPYPAAQPRRRPRAFGDLMAWLDGHPLSMRLILPHLDTTEPSVLLDGLHGTAPLPGADALGAGRTTSLAASITYSYAHLSAGTRRRLAAVSLFHGVTDADVLMLFSQAAGVPGRFQGASRQEWGQALDEATRVGLLARLGRGMYQIHPALPAYLAAQWRAAEPGDHAAVREAATQALLTAYAGLGGWLDEQIESADAGLAFTIIGLQRRTMGSLLGYALDHRLWEQAQHIAQPLASYWQARGLYEEADSWTDRVRLATEDHDGTAPPLDSPAGGLWLFFTGDQANRQLESGRLDQAERTYQQILASLQTQPASAQRQARLAISYHQLGMVNQERGELDDAEDWYTKALAIKEELGDRASTANTYHQLGMTAEDRGGLEDAEDWYTKALAIKEELGDRPGTAGTYHQLGNVAHRRGRLDDAEDWYTKALAIEEELGNRPRMADTYHQLGMTAQSRGRLEDAEDWYTKALAINEELGNRPGIAITFGQLGLLAEKRDQLSQALEWMVRCVALFTEFPHPATGPGPEHLARLTARLGTGALERCWQAVTGNALPRAVRDYVDSSAHPGGAR
jgi:tetratricopeptide (TPR) repeat protein